MKSLVPLLFLPFLIGTVLGQGNVCDSCVQAAEYLKEKLDDASTPRGLIELKEQICGPLPEAVQEICGQAIDNTLPVLKQKLQEPVQVCGGLGLCTSEEQIIRLSRSNSDEISCPLCEYFVSYVKEQLQDPETEAELIDQAAQACANLPTDVQHQCLAYIAQYSQQIFAAIGESDPEEVCAMAGLCDASLRVPELSPTLKEEIEQFSTSRNDDQCDTCQLVIAQASSALADPGTQKEILAYIKQSCEDFASFEDQCKDYIDLYGPLALNMARQYLTPDICTQLGFCSSAFSDRQFAA